MSINDTHVHITELGIWINKTADGILTTYDKKMITRKRNQMIKSNPADVAKIDAAITAAKAAVAGTKIDAAQPLLDAYKSVPSMGISRNWGV